MDGIVLVGIAFGLSLDAFTVALTSSTVTRDLGMKHGFRMALFFGFFQFLMPVLGWAAGTTFSGLIQGFDHWVAFGLLALVGGRMVWEGLPIQGNRDEGACSDEKQDCTKLSVLFFLSVATSIDALAIGLSFAMLKTDIILPSVLIGLITFGVSLAGYFLGRRIGDRLKLNLDLVGGLVLVAIGVKILVEHLV